MSGFRRGSHVIGLLGPARSRPSRGVACTRRRNSHSAWPRNQRRESRRPGLKQAGLSPPAASRFALFRRKRDVHTKHQDDRDGAEGRNDRSSPGWSSWRRRRPLLSVRRRSLNEHPHHCSTGHYRPNRNARRSRWQPDGGNSLKSYTRCPIQGQIIEWPKLIFTRGVARVTMARKTTFKYHLMSGLRVLHRGITNNLRRRQSEHRRRFPGATIVQIGRRTTRKAALRWERAGGRRPYRKSR